MTEVKGGPGPRAAPADGLTVAGGRLTVPIAILYNFFVDRFIAGFTVGAIK